MEPEKTAHAEQNALRLVPVGPEQLASGDQIGMLSCACLSSHLTDADPEARSLDRGEALHLYGSVNQVMQGEELNRAATVANLAVDAQKMHNI